MDHLAEFVEFLTRTPKSLHPISSTEVFSNITVPFKLPLALLVATKFVHLTVATLLSKLVVVGVSQSTDGPFSELDPSNFIVLRLTRNPKLPAVLLGGLA